MTRLRNFSIILAVLLVAFSCTKDPLKEAPILKTATVTNINSTTVATGGEILYDGNAAIVSRGVCWSTTANPTISGSRTTDGNGAGSFTSTITGLAPNTTFYIRTYAVNSAGTFYGNQVTAATTLTGSVSDVNKLTLLNLVNEVRTKGCNCGTEKMPPVAPLVWDNQLEIAAIEHDLDMSKNNYFDHTGTDNSTPATRITKTGFIFKSCGENIAMGFQTEQQVVNGWLNSPGHCKNIMTASFKFMGVGKVGTYWTQVFAGK
jgi:uncharacterized protein YkwD